MFLVSGISQPFNNSPKSLKVLQSYNLPMFLRDRRREKKLHVFGLGCPGVVCRVGQGHIDDPSGGRNLFPATIGRYKKLTLFLRGLLEK